MHALFIIHRKQEELTLCHLLSSSLCMDICSNYQYSVHPLILAESLRNQYCIKIHIRVPIVSFLFFVYLSLSFYWTTHPSHLRMAWH